MQTDTALVNGVLTRIDLAAAKLNVTAEQMWNIWRSAHWLPLIEVTGLWILTLILGWILYKIYKLKQSNDDDGAKMWVLVIGGILFGVMVVTASTFTPSAIMAAVNPDWYALSQLQQIF
jgi:hypothetical protein